MKRILLTAFSAAAIAAAAQNDIHDTVTTSAAYANDIWYSLQNDNQGSQPRANWDLAFEANGYTTAILINSGNGVELYQTNMPASDFSVAINPSDVSSMPKRYNTDTSWAYGAFNLPSTSQYDLGWGVYNPTTHIVTGDSVYVMKLANGAYKKILIDDLNGGTYNFRYDDLGGTGSGTSVSVVKSAYATKNFGYYSIQNGQALDREPAATSWDLLFTKYTAFIPSAYGVTGVLQNKGVLVQQANDIANPATSVPSSSVFNQEINTIGYDWKTYNMSAGSYGVGADTVYFVKDKTGNTWRLRFTGFGGSNNGNYMFTKTLLSSTTGIHDEEGNSLGSLALYPNPANGESVNLVFSMQQAGSQPSVSVYALDGRLLKASRIEQFDAAQLNQYRLDLQGLPAGIYTVKLEAAGGSISKKLVITQ